MDLKARLQLSDIFILRDFSVVEHVSDRVAVMHLGRLVEVAPAAELFAKPRHLYSEALISDIPSPVGRERINLKGDPPSPESPPSGCPFHPRRPKAFGDCEVTRPELEASPKKVARLATCLRAPLV